MRLPRSLSAGPMLMWSLISGVGVCGALSACGADKRAVATPPVATVREGGEGLRLPAAGRGIRLAKLNLPDNAVFYIAAKRCSDAVPHCYEFVEELAEPSRRGSRHADRTRVVGVGQRIDGSGAAEQGLLVVKGREECVANLPVAMAYGTLSARGDSVVVRGGAHAMTLNKAEFPAQMGLHGVLVYGLLAPHSDEVVVRTPNGGIASRERGALVQSVASCKA